MNNTAVPYPVVQENVDISENVISESQELVIPEDVVVKGVLVSPSGISSFRQDGMPVTNVTIKNYGTKEKPRQRQIRTLIYPGRYLDQERGQLLLCPHCGKKLYDSGDSTVVLNHLPNGDTYTKLEIHQRRVRCITSGCGYNFTFHADFKAQDHMITAAMENFTMGLLAYGLTLTTVAHLTGLSRPVVKEIDMKRLQEMYTVDGENLIKPKNYAKFLAIDEFKLHDGYKYATVIIDLETGHILWLAHGKKKACVYDFIEHVGMDWMKHVKAVACDMNSDFEEAFLEKCSHLKVIYDRFHIMKNFNDKVISEVRKDEQKRLKEEGKEDEAANLKHSKYILMASRDTRTKHDKAADEGKLVSKASPLFNKPEVRALGGMENKYQSLINENTLLFTVDLVKEQLNEAFSKKTVTEMRSEMKNVIKICREANNKHFTWFANLIENHIDGIVWYARYHISTSKLEGTNNMIKTERRKGYGYPDDEYFFLRIMDASYRKDRF